MDQIELRETSTGLSNLVCPSYTPGSDIDTPPTIADKMYHSRHMGSLSRQESEESFTVRDRDFWVKPFIIHAPQSAQHA